VNVSNVSVVSFDEAVTEVHLVDTRVAAKDHAGEPGPLLVGAANAQCPVTTARWPDLRGAA